MLASIRRCAAIRASALALLLSACDVPGGLIATDGGLSLDLGFDPGFVDASSILPSDVIETDEVLEDFENRSFVDPALSEQVIIDTNRGVATLPAERFPTLPSGPITNLVQTSQFEGVVEASTILLEPGVQVEATDAIELRAADTLRISGRLRAGPGGVTLVAGRSIFVDGRIESSGPIRLRLASEDGVMHVSGKLLTGTMRSSSSAEISLIARGPIELSGEIRTGEGTSNSGAVLVSSYHDVVLTGAECLVASGAASAGSAGSVRILSEGSVRASEGVIISTGRLDYEPAGQLGDGAGGGDIEIRAVANVHLSSGTRLKSAFHPRELGGALRVVAGDELEIAAAGLEAGSGGVGGLIHLEARTATIGPEVSAVAGTGETGGGEVEIATATRLHIQGASARGGASDCGNAGSVRVHVGGAATVGENVALLGGAGGRSANRCIQGGRGGDVVILLREGDSEAWVDVAVAGYGAQNGERSVTVDPNYERPMPDVRVRTLGVLVSRIIDRGEAATGTVPQLRSFIYAAPPETMAKVQLAGASSLEGPFEPWIDASLEDDEALRSLKAARFFRYRLWLQGRALDAPEVDAFELDLDAP